MIEPISDQASRVDLPGGPVTLESLDDLTTQIEQLEAEAKQILQSSEAPIANARLKVEQAGELLMAHTTERDTNAVANQVAAATQLKADVSQLSQQIQDFASRSHTGLGGFLHSLTDGHHEHELIHKAGCNRGHGVNPCSRRESAYLEGTDCVMVFGCDALEHEGDGRYCITCQRSSVKPLANRSFDFALGSVPLEDSR